MEDEKLIRQFETAILDEYYKQIPFSRYSELSTIPYLLKVFGDYQRQYELFEQSGYSENSFQSFLTTTLNGISCCIRWIQSDRSTIATEKLSHEALSELALEFIKWGNNYYTLMQNFIAWSRKLQSARITNDKEITFELPDRLDYGMLMIRDFLHAKYLQNRYLGFPHQRFTETFEEWYKQIEAELAPPIASSINWSSARKTKLFDEFRSVLKGIILSELNENTDMGGYTLGDFLTFHTVLSINFYFITWIEKIQDEKYGTNFNPYGSNPLNFNLNGFIDFIAKITALETAAVKHIIADLTFDYRSLHSSLIIQPFVLTECGELFILPNIYPYIDPGRMLAGAFNKGAKKRLYSSLINIIEKAWLDKINALINITTKWKCYTNKKFVIAQKQITPDFVLIDEITNSILVIDYKHFLAPLSASEVAYKSAEIDKGFKQVRNYISILPSIPELQGNAYYGMLLSPMPLVIPIEKSETVYLMDFESLEPILKSSLTDLTIPSLIKLLNSAQSYSSKGMASPTDEIIQVSDWKIKRMQWGSDDPIFKMF